jgi:hypothetical protein
MRVKLSTDLRGPAGAIREVYLKVHSGHSTWYIIQLTEEYPYDTSPIERDDKVLYMHPEFKDVKEFLDGHELVKDKYTFVPGSEVEELLEVKNNSEAIHLLGREY